MTAAGIKVQLEGRLLADPIERMGNKAPFWILRVAVTRQGKELELPNKETQDFDGVDCLTSDREVAKSFTKGMAVYVKGDLQLSVWEDKKYKAVDPKVSKKPHPWKTNVAVRIGTIGPVTGVSRQGVIGEALPSGSLAGV